MTFRAPKIVVYHNILWPRYKGAIFSRLYLSCQRAGIEVEFVHIAETLAPYARLGPVDLSYHQYPYRLLIPGDYQRASRLRILWRIASDLLRHRADLFVLPGYELPQYWMMLALCMLLRRRRAVFCDSTRLDNPPVAIRDFAKRLFFSRCDGIFCYGQRSMEYMRGYGIARERIYFPCQAAALPHDYDAGAVEAAYDQSAPLALAAPQFVYFGRLAHEKGIDDLLLAFLAVRGRLPAARLNLVGAGPLEATLRARILELELQAAVTLQPARPLLEVVPLLYTSVALVLPSHREPWGLVVNEALSYGCPVVVSDRCGCVPELVVEGITGYSFACGDVERLAAAMLAAVELSRDRPSTVRRCLTLMSAYTPQRAADHILDGCRHLIARQS